MNCVYDYILHFNENLDIISQIDNDNKLKNYFLTIETDNIIIFKCIINNKIDCYNKSCDVLSKNILSNTIYYNKNYFNIKTKILTTIICSRCLDHYNIYDYKDRDEEKGYGKCSCQINDYHEHEEEFDIIYEIYYVNKDMTDNIYNIKLYNLDLKI